MKRVAPPASDEQLAAAERTDNVRRINREAQIEDEQEQERLAAAGEPTAQEAIKAMASVIDSRPVGEVDDDIETTAQTPRETTPPINRKPRKVKSRNADNRDSEAAAPAPQEEPDDDASRSRNEKLAWRLMDTAYKKWEKTARKDLQKANRELALDLGKDAVLYYRNEMIRMSDLHGTIEKLTAASKAGKDNPDAEDNFDEEMEEFRKQLRDGK